MSFSDTELEGIKQRKRIRYYTQFPVRIIQGNNETEAVVSDCSTKGLGIISTYKHPVQADNADFILLLGARQECVKGCIVNTFHKNRNTLLEEALNNHILWQLTDLGTKELDFRTVKTIYKLPLHYKRKRFEEILGKELTVTDENEMIKISAPSVITDETIEDILSIGVAFLQEENQVFEEILSNTEEDLFNGVMKQVEGLIKSGKL
jgi:hypothetical protein